MARPGRLIYTLLPIALAGLLFAACSSEAPATPTLAAGGQPTVVIESPANGSPTPVGQPLVVQARAEDPAAGVNRIDLRVGGILVDSASTPGLAAQPTFSAALEYVPSADGVVTVSVTAYRPDGTASAPAEITVAVVVSGSSVPPLATPAAGATPTPTSVAATLPPTPGITPTAAPRPTLPPFATASPSPSPSPSPIAIDVGLTVPAAPPVTLDVGTAYTFTVTVRNDGPGTAPRLTLRGRLCNPTGGCGQGDDIDEVTISDLAAGAANDYELTLTPEVTGPRQLRFRLILPAGYVDPTPGDLALDYAVDVVGPTPSPSPVASPSPAASPSP